MPAGLAAVSHSRVEMGHLFESVGKFLGRTLEVLVEPVVAFSPSIWVRLFELLAKMLPHEWVSVQSIRLGWIFLG